jgi:hypothetical protein
MFRHIESGLRCHQLTPLQPTRGSSTSTRKPPPATGIVARCADFLVEIEIETETARQHFTYGELEATTKT